MEEKDVFISYAGEDKETIVDPLVKAFDEYGISYWLDKIEIAWGDSVIDKVNYGLQKSRFVLVLLSNSFINKNWPTKEINIALSMEIKSGDKKVLPLLIAPQEIVFNKFPLIRDKLYLQWPEDPTIIAEKMVGLLGRKVQNRWIYNHPADYTGLIWIKISPMPNNTIRNFDLRIIWGHWHYETKIQTKDNSPIYLWHTKGDNGLSLPIYLIIEPKCFVTFGQGYPPTGALDINQNWRQF